MEGALPHTRGRGLEPHTRGGGTPPHIAKVSGVLKGKAREPKRILRNFSAPEWQPLVAILVLPCEEPFGFTSPPFPNPRNTGSSTSWFSKKHTHTHTHTSTLEWLGGAGGCGWVGGWGWWGGAGWWLGGVGRVGWWVGVGLGRWAGWSFRCACFLTMPPLRCTHTDIRLHVFVFSVRPDLGVNQKIILCSMHRSQNYFLSLGNKPLEPAPSLSQAGFLGMGVHPPPT